MESLTIFCGSSNTLTASSSSSSSRHFFPRKTSSSSLSFRSSNSSSSHSRELWGIVNSQRLMKKKSNVNVMIRAEMFGQLTTGLESAWNKLKGEEVLTKENIVEPMRDIRRALLEADVSLPVVRRFVQTVSEQAVGVGVIRGVKPDQQLVKIVSDELVKLMGGEVSELTFAKSSPTVILLAGLQGVGKTTVSAKLACYLKKQGKSCMLIAGDVYRPAAIDQLVILGKQVDVPVYTAGTDVKPAEIARQGLQEAKKKNVDVVIMDTAGRLQIDKTMMDELKDVKRTLNPTEVLLVVDAMTGQEAAALVTTFNLEIGITGAILTKLDGDSRGGAALSVKEVSGKPIKLVGRGERMEDLEPFYPDRMAGRILGMGDVLSFVEKAQEVMKQEDAEDLQKKIMSAKFDFNDFLKQTRAVARMGSMSRVLGMIPGMGKVTPAQIREAEKSLQIMEAMIEVMTPEEREQPELLAESPARRKRIAQESGKTELQVSQLVAQLFQMRVKMKNLMGAMEGGSVPALSNLEEAMKSEQKDLFGAGTDTSSSTLEWAMAEVQRNPLIMKKAKAELEQVIGKGKIVQEDDISNLPYLSCIVKETLRMHPPVPFLIPRKVDKQVKLNGYTIPENTRVLVNVYAIGRDPAIWEDSQEFKPERFLASKVDVMGQDFELIPFGAGRRKCPGLLLAVRIIPMMLGSLLNSFDWKVIDDTPNDQLDMTDKFGFTLQKAIPLCLFPIPLN